jgi:hypothetical protein
VNTKWQNIILVAWGKLNKVANRRSHYPSDADIQINPVDRAIVITTFSGRFFSYCLPLVQALRNSNVDEPIYVVVNGDIGRPFDPVLRSDFLGELSKFPATYPICVGSFRSMAHQWNSGIRLADAEVTVVLNDDLAVNPLSAKPGIAELFRRGGQNGLSIMNSSFGHFAVSRTSITELGWFDERFLSIGEEDGDYAWRFEATYGTAPDSFFSTSFLNESSEIGYEDFSKGTGKYGLFNKIFASLKYEFGVGAIKGMFGQVASPRIPALNPYPSELWRSELAAVSNVDDVETIRARIQEII